MPDDQKVIVACPKCGQKLRCVAGGAGQCPKCGTRVVFPESIYMADPDLNRAELERLANKRNTGSTNVEAKSAAPKKKKGGALKKILIAILALVVIGGGVFGVFRLRDIFFGHDETQDADSGQSIGSDWEVDYNGETEDLTQGTDSTSITLQRPEYNAAADPDAELADGTQTYVLTAGMYTVGDDISPGVYDIAWVSGGGNCFVRDASGSSVVNEIFGDTSYSGRITSYNNARVPSGGEVEISGDLTVAFNPPA